MESSEVTELEPTSEIKNKQQFSGKVSKISLAGALIDIGHTVPAVLHISQILPGAENEPVKRVEDVLQIGQEIEVWVKKVKGDHIELTMFKPLDLEWRDIKKGMTVKGTVVRLEKFGAFVEIGAERPGLIHISEMAHGYVRQPSDVVKEGDEVESQVLDANRRKKQIKLSIKALTPEPEPVVVVEEPVRHTMDFSQPKEKPVRRPKKAPRKQRGENEGAEFNFNLQENAQAEAEPTFMEIAIREAMERAKSRKVQQDEKKKATGVSKEQDEILSRTLGQKERAG